MVALPVVSEKFLGKACEKYSKLRWKRYRDIEVFMWKWHMHENEHMQ